MIFLNHLASFAIESPMRQHGSRVLARLFVRTALALTLAAVTPLVRSQEPGSVEAAVAKAEPAVATVIVSRSEWYRKLGLSKESDAPGQLGGFDAVRDIDDFRIGVQANDSDQTVLERRLTFRLKLDLSNPNHAPEAFGSGLVVDAQGLVLTNYHVVQDATKVYVRLPGGKGSYADIWAADPRSDLAVLKLLTPGLRLTPIVFGNADNLRRGQQVIALANTFAAGQRDGQPSVSVGVISNISRRVPGRKLATENNASPLYQYGILIQTDARIGLGSSGGALINLQGECIGITTSLAAVAGSDAPGGFALPINTAFRKVIDILKRGEEVEYGFLGVAVNDLADGRGATVGDATDGSPALAARLMPGDVITAIGSHPVRDSQDLMLGLGLYFAGDRVTITYQRAGAAREQKTEATLVKYLVQGKKIASSLGNRPYVDGLRVDHTSLLVQRPNTAHKILPGVLVTELKPGTKAAQVFFPGDIITHVGSDLVMSPAEFYTRIARHNDPVDIMVRRGAQSQRIRW